MTLVFCNRQRTQPVDLRLLRRVTRHLLANELRVNEAEIGIHLVEPEEMASVNERFLQHAGPTDVITFDHAEPNSDVRLHGELFICVAVAIQQACVHGTIWIFDSDSEKELFIDRVNI